MRYYLNETFRPFAVPYNARYVDTVEIGSNIQAGLGLEVAVWEGVTEGKNNEYGQIVIASERVCTSQHNNILIFKDGGYFSSSFTTKRTQPGEPWNGEYCLPVSDSYIRGETYYSSHRYAFCFSK